MGELGGGRWVRKIKYNTLEDYPNLMKLNIVDLPHEKNCGYKTITCILDQIKSMYCEQSWPLRNVRVFLRH